MVVPKAIRAARQKGRKGECHVMKITKKNGKKTEGYRRQLKEKARIRRGRREGDKSGIERQREREGIGREGILEAREKLCCSLMA